MEIAVAIKAELGADRQYEEWVEELETRYPPLADVETLDEKPEPAAGQPAPDENELDEQNGASDAQLEAEQTTDTEVGTGADGAPDTEASGSKQQEASEAQSEGNASSGKAAG